MDTGEYGIGAFELWRLRMPPGYVYQSFSEVRCELGIMFSMIRQCFRYFRIVLPYRLDWMNRPCYFELHRQ